mgnify:CR=1 FL=1
MKGGSTELIIGIVLVFVIIGISIYLVIGGGPPKPCPVDETGQNALTEDCDCSGTECSEDKYCYDNTCNASSKDLCNPDPCNGNGVCTDGNCDCASGFSGTNCETALEPCTDENNCNGNGVASGFAGNCSCECNATHTGTTCEYESSINLESSQCNTRRDKTCHPITRVDPDVEAGDERSWACDPNYYLIHTDNGGMDCQSCPTYSHTPSSIGLKGATNPHHCICDDGKYLQANAGGRFTCTSCGTGKIKDPNMSTGTVEDCMCDESNHWYDTGTGAGTTCIRCNAEEIYSSSQGKCICNGPLFTRQGDSQTCQMDRSCMVEEATGGWVPKCGFLKGSVATSITFEQIPDSFKTAFTNPQGEVDSNIIMKYESWLTSNDVCTPPGGTCRCPATGFNGTCSACSNENDTLMYHPDTESFSCEPNPCLKTGSDIIGLGCLSTGAQNDFITGNSPSDITFTNSSGVEISGDSAVSLLGELCPAQPGGEQTDRCGTEDFCSPLNRPAGQGGGQAAGADVSQGGGQAADAPAAPVLGCGVRELPSTQIDRGDIPSTQNQFPDAFCFQGDSQTPDTETLCNKRYRRQGPAGRPVGHNICEWINESCHTGDPCTPGAGQPSYTPAQPPAQQPAGEFFQVSGDKCDCIIPEADRTSSGSGKLCNSTACLQSDGSPYCQVNPDETNLNVTDHPHGCDISSGRPTCICASGFIQDADGQCLVPAVDCGTTDSGASIENNPAWKQDEYNTWVAGEGRELKVDEEHNRSYKKDTSSGRKVWVHECTNPENKYNPFTRNQCKVNQFWDGTECKVYADIMCSNSWDQDNYIGKYLEESPRCSFGEGVTGGLISSDGGLDDPNNSRCCKSCDREGIINPLSEYEQRHMSEPRSAGVGDRAHMGSFPGYNSRPGNYGAVGSRGSSPCDQSGCDDTDASSIYRKNLFTCQPTNPPNWNEGGWGTEPTTIPDHETEERDMTEQEKTLAWFDIMEPSLVGTGGLNIQGNRAYDNVCTEDGAGMCNTFPKIWRTRGKKYYTVQGYQMHTCTRSTAGGGKDLSDWQAVNSNDDTGNRANTHANDCNVTRFRESGDSQPPDQLCRGETAGWEGGAEDGGPEATDQQYDNCTNDECYKCNFP